MFIQAVDTFHNNKNKNISYSNDMNLLNLATELLTQILQLGGQEWEFRDGAAIINLPNIFQA